MGCPSRTAKERKAKGRAYLVDARRRQRAGRRRDGWRRRSPSRRRQGRKTTGGEKSEKREKGGRKRDEHGCLSVSEPSSSQPATHLKLVDFDSIASQSRSERLSPTSCRAYSQARTRLALSSSSVFHIKQRYSFSCVRKVFEMEFLYIKYKLITKLITEFVYKLRDELIKIN